MKQKDFLTILVPLFILTILWVIFNIYHNHVTSTIEDPLNLQIIPIEGKFDTQTVNKIKERQRIEPNFNSVIDTDLSPTPSPEIEITDETATDSAEDTQQGL